MQTKDYLNFDLLVDRVGDGYRARVLDSPSGQAVGSFDLPFSDLEVENFILRMGRNRGRNVRRLESSEMEAAREFGGRLYQAVFQDQIASCLQGSLSEARARGQGLRVRLRLSETPELMDLPWEFLYNASLNRFFSLSVDTPVVRYLDMPGRIEPLRVESPLRVLVIISSPIDYGELDVEAEWSRLKEAVAELEARGLIELERLQPATLAQLQRTLRRGNYHVFHYIGHGGFDERAQDGVLMLEDRHGRGRAVSGQHLGMLLHDEKGLQLAVLNACEGARTSRTDPFSGVGQSFLQQGIPAVIAMQFEVSDDAAIAMAHEFYAALADGYPVDAALVEARKAIFARSDVEWGTPVLYLRAPDGQIFDVVPRPAAPEVGPAPVPTPEVGPAPKPTPEVGPAPKPAPEIQPPAEPKPEIQPPAEPEPAPEPEIEAAAATVVPEAVRAGLANRAASRPLVEPSQERAGPAPDGAGIGLPVPLPVAAGGAAVLLILLLLLALPRLRGGEDVVPPAVEEVATEPVLIEGPPTEEIVVAPPTEAVDPPPTSTLEEVAVLAPLPTPRAFDPPAGRPGSNGVIQAIPASFYLDGGLILIDGEEEEWWRILESSGIEPTALSFTVWDHPSQGGCAATHPTGSGTDLAADVAFAYDEGALQVAYWVLDDGFAPNPGDPTFYFQGDAPQLRLDMDLTGDFNSESFSGDDRQIDLLPGDSAIGVNPAAAIWTLNDQSRALALSGARVAAAPFPGGYFVEASIPWQSLGAFPGAGGALGLSPSVSDNDTPGRAAQECMVSAVSFNRVGDNPTRWATLILEPVP